jgi:hypothetical protein
MRQRSTWAIIVLAISVSIGPRAVGGERSLADATKFDIRGVRLFMDAREVEAILKKGGEFETVRLDKGRCVDSTEECYSSLYAAGKGWWLSVNFDSELPDNPHSSIAVRVTLHYNPSKDRLPPTAEDFEKALIAKYGPPDGGHAGVYWWGALGPNAKPGTAEWRGPQHPYLVGETAGQLTLADPHADERHRKGYQEWLERTRQRTPAKF